MRLTSLGLFAASLALSFAACSESPGVDPGRGSPASGRRGHWGEGGVEDDGPEHDDSTGVGQAPSRSGGGGNGAGTSGPTCEHSVCQTGVALARECDTCAELVCDEDPYCCLVEWDPTCLVSVNTYCDKSVCRAVGEVKPGDLVITEIMANPKVVPDEQGEWFEIYNAASWDIDLMGYVIRHNPASPSAKYVIDEHLVIPAGDYLVLGKNANSAENGNIPMDYSYGHATIELLNTGVDSLILETPDGLVIDETTWDNGVLSPVGASRTLDANHLSAAKNDDDVHFCAATTVISGSSDKGTPGAPNDPCP